MYLILYHYALQSDMYSIGLILFELYQPFCTGMERSKSLIDLRKGIVTPAFTERWPKLVSDNYVTQKCFRSGKDLIFFKFIYV
jgi:hypothetical protein